MMVMPDIGPFHLPAATANQAVTITAATLHRAGSTSLVSYICLHLYDFARPSITPGRKIKSTHIFLPFTVWKYKEKFHFG